MTEKTNRTIRKLIYILGITIAVYLGMRFILPMVIPFLLAYGVAWCLKKPVKKLCALIHLPRGVVSLVAVVVFAGAVLLPLVYLLYKGICELGLLLSNYRHLTAQADGLWCSCCERIEQLSGIDADYLIDFGRTRITRMAETAQEKIIPYAMNVSLISLKYVAAFFAQLLVFLVAAVIILNDYEGLSQWLQSCQFYGSIETIGNHMRLAGGTFIKAQLCIIAMICAACVIGLYIMGNPYALVIGILIGICDALPFIGTGLILIPWLIIEVFRGAYTHAVILGIIFIVCTFIREFIEPKLVGKGLGVHPLAVLMSVYIGIEIYGATGVLLGPLSVFLIYELYKMFVSDEKRKT